MSAEADMVSGGVGVSAGATSVGGTAGSTAAEILVPGVIAAATSKASVVKGRSRKDHKFYTDIEEMMFGFGDEWPPDSNAVCLLESLVISYIEDLAVRALDIAELRGKLDKECFMFLVRKDRKKFSRVHKLLKSNEELKTVQKVELKEDI